MSAHPSRRSFIVGCSAALTAAFVGRIREARATSKAVSVVARAGEIFPPLALSRKLARAGHETTMSGGVWKRAQGELEFLDVAIFPDVVGEAPVGPLAPGDLIALKPKIRTLLVREFGFAARSIEFVDPPGFWYPFTDHGAICCRLVVTAV